MIPNGTATLDAFLDEKSVMVSWLCCCGVTVSFLGIAEAHTTRYRQSEINTFAFHCQLPVPTDVRFWLNSNKLYSVLFAINVKLFQLKWFIPAQNPDQKINTMRAL